MTNKVKLLKVKEREGRELLQMRPLDKDVYADWSNSAREAVGGSLGTSSDQLKQLVEARREISVRYETDPSYHLTQVGANLRRELTVLRSCIAKLGDDPTPRNVFRRPARVVASLLEERGVASPTSTGKSTKAERKGEKLLVLLNESAQAHRAVRSAVESLKACVIQPVDDAEILAKILKGNGGIAYGVVVLSDDGDLNLSDAKAAFALGVLAGSLGPDHVCALHPEGMRPVFEQAGILHVSLQDPDGWRTRIVEHFRSVGLTME